MGKDKLTKEEKKAREIYRTNVCHAVEGLRRTPLSGSEKRYLMKKDFLPNSLRHEVVELLCDFVEANCVGVSGLFEEMEQENAISRALWYSFATYAGEKAEKKKKGKDGEERFDPYGESQNKFDVDIRTIKNIHVVTEGLLLYCRDAKGDYFSRAGFDTFVSSMGAVGGDDGKQKAAIGLLLKDLDAPHLAAVHRIVNMVNNLPVPEDKKRAARAFGAALFHVEGSSPEAAQNSRNMREDAFEVLIRSPELLPAQYVPTQNRLGQSRHYVPARLKENEWEILLDGAEKVKVKAGHTVVEENTLQDSLYRVVEGSFSVIVGQTRVATLISLDWFGEMAFLGNRYSHAKVVADKKGGVVYKIPFGKLEAILLSRPDLSAKFYGLLAVEDASRLNIALIQSNRNAAAKDVAVNPQSTQVPHVLRTSSMVRNKESGESGFMYDANIHAVRAWHCEHVPDKKSKKPRPAIAFVFPTCFTTLVHKGFSEKKVIIPFKDVRDFSLEEQGSRITIVYAHGKKQRSLCLQFKDVTTAQAVTAITARIRNGDIGTMEVKDFGPISGIAVFNFASNRPNELPVSSGDRVTVLDQVGEWYYGFKNAEPEKKGLFPVAFVELRPIGVGQQGVMDMNSWKGLEEHFVRHSLSKGDVVLAEGDKVKAGNLLFVESGELSAQRKMDNGLVQHLGTLVSGETLGELIFLLGGVPRASVTVATEKAEVLELPRAKLLTLFSDDVLAAKFWKYLCCVISSRLFAVQARLNSSIPIPDPVAFELPKEEEAKAVQLGSVPKLPELPPPAIDPKDALIMKIKERGAFFLGVDVPSEVDLRVHQATSPRNEEGAEEKN